VGGGRCENFDGWCSSTALDPAEFVQPLHKSGGPLARCRRVGRAEEPDGRQLRPLLRPRRERPRDRRANHAANKFAPPHAIPRRINQWAKAVYAGALSQSSDEWSNASLANRNATGSHISPAKAPIRSAMIDVSGRALSNSRIESSVEGGLRGSETNTPWRGLWGGRDQEEDHR
jgi:hypothetical protein